MSLQDLPWGLAVGPMEPQRAGSDIDHQTDGQPSRLLSSGTCESFGPGEGRQYQGPSRVVGPPATYGNQTVEAPVPLPNVGDGEQSHRGVK